MGLDIEWLLSVGSRILVGVDYGILKCQIV